MKIVIDFAMMRRNDLRKGEFFLGKKKWKVGVTDILLLLVNGIFFVGMRTFLAPCGQQADGHWMVCHWAGEALAGVSAVLFIIAVLHAAVPRAHIKAGLALASIPVSVLAILLPGHLIDLCMMETMRCHTVMQPGVTAISAVTIALLLVDLYLYRKGD